MKKVYLLGAVFFALFANAQEFAAVSSSPSSNVSPTKAPGVIYSQPVEGTSGIVSDVLSNGSYVAAADDFILTDNSVVSRITVTGFQNQGNLETVVSTGLIMYIYTDANGMPSGNPTDAAQTPVAKIDLSKSSPAYSLVKTGSTYAYSVNIPLALGKGISLNKNTTYWLVFAAKTNLSAYTGATRFNWYTAARVGNKAKLIDPSDAFQAGATNWTDISELTEDASFDGLTFTIEGETALGTGEIYNSNKVSISPNPTSDYLNFNAKVKSVQIIDAAGRNVSSAKVANNQVDVRNLAKGVYIVKFETENGTQTEKFIKK